VLSAAVALLLFAALVFSASAQAVGGTVTGWGANESAQVAPPASPELRTPTPVGGLSDVAQVASGAYHTLAAISDGTARSWGYNYEGELGNGTTTDNPVPSAIPGLSNVVAVAAGDYHSLALLSNGTVMAWGENVYGQLGVGTFTGPDTCTIYSCSKTPAAVPGISNAIAISAADDASMALLADGTVMAWGYDYYGQLGDGIGHQTGCQCVDHPVPVPGVSNAIAASLGEYGGSALLADGTVRSWGYNYYGEVGDGTTKAVSPTGCYCVSAATATGLSGVKAIAAGGYHRLALQAGGAQAWGYNYDGELGNGTTVQTGCQCVPVPGPVAGLSSPQSIAATHYFSLALLADGTVRSWGYSFHGELGDGAIVERATPGPVGGLSGVSAVAAGYENGFAIIGPSQTLNVALAGAGSGTVGASGIACPVANCTAKFPQGQIEILRATSTAGGFAGFSGPCAGTGSCQVNMGADQTVTATFGIPKGTAITKSDVNSKKKKATFSFSAPGAITGYECKLVKPKPKKHKKGKAKGHKRLTLAKKKQKPAKFTACTGPAKYKNLKPGKYTFSVRALDILGADATPAVKKFTIKKPKPKKKS
jgi:alpha-tubulin suppressor-like RCC1 family protein